MLRIALSYRRADSADSAARLYDRLQQRFGEGNVFIDIDDIPPGVDFRDHIAAEFQSVDVVLAVIGVSWLSRDAAGASRLHEANDPVRVEIELAQKLGVALVPVLVDGADMPAASDLPEAIRDFCFLNAAKIGDAEFEADVARLGDALLARAPKARAQQVSAPPTQPASFALAPAAQAPRRGRREPRPPTNLAARLEAFFVARGPLESAVLAIFGAFILTILSQVFDLAWLDYETPSGAVKEIGFLSAPNWTFVYWVLLPPFLALFSVMLTQWRATITTFCDRGVITASDGSRAPSNAVFMAWRASQRKASRVLWILMIAALAQTLSEWIKICYIPLTTGEIGSFSVDWGRLAIVEPDKADAQSALIFTAIAYAYMGLTLSLYLAIMAHIVSSAVFLSEISGDTGRFRLRDDGAVLPRGLRDLAAPIFACCALGVGPAICMRMQVEYLRSDHTNVAAFAFQDIFWVLGLGSTTQKVQAFTIPSEFTSFAVLCVTLFVLMFALYQIFLSFENARRRSASTPHSNGGFFSAVLPQSGIMAVIIAGVVASYFFVGISLIWLCAALTALLAMRFTRRMRE